MASPVITTPTWEPSLWTDPLDSIPILYEDEEEDDMGEASYHVETDEIFHVCMTAHMERHHPDLRVYRNMNLYYKKDGPLHPVTRSLPYVSPDGMVVQPYPPAPRKLTSYTIGQEGPAPVLVAEILSKRSAQQRDLHEKLIVYAKLGIKEYLLIDSTGLHLKERLLLKRLQPDGTWTDEKDPDGGVTSELQFRIILDADGEIRLLDLKTGERYVRPFEAQAEAKARQIAEEYGQAQAEARILAEEQARLAREQARLAAAARRLADEKTQAEAEARRLAEERLQSLQAEVERLRQQLDAKDPT